MYLGTNTLSPDAGSLTVTTTSFIRHASYSSSTLQNDIAVVKIPTPVTTTSYYLFIFINCLFVNNKQFVRRLHWITWNIFVAYIRPITLASATLAEGVSLTVSGWGRISDSKWYY